MDDIIVRKANVNDMPAIAAIHFNAYFNRFFDINAKSIAGVPYGAPLAREHPVLAVGQSAEYFDRYWNAFAETLWMGGDDENICYVAESDSTLIGFVKGSAAEANRDDFYKTSLVPSGPVAELGSIYIDPAKKLMRTGKKLVVTYANSMRERGYDQMATSAYYLNDSPRFFEMMGAENIGPCAIPNQYIDYENPERPLKIEVIKGVMLYWAPQTFSQLCAYEQNKPAAGMLQGLKAGG